MISVEQSQLGQAQQPVTNAAAVGKAVKKGDLLAHKQNKLTSQEEKYEFKKTARQDIFDVKFECVWDQTGRYVAVYGVKRSPLDKTEKSIRFFNIFGEPSGVYGGLQNLMQFKWRPRPLGILSNKELAKLKADGKTKYQKQFKEEEKVEKKIVTSIQKESKKSIRDEFLNTFFLPLRKEFEDQRDKYEALWPIKPKDMVDQLVEIEIIYSYENVVSETRIQ